MTIKDKKRKRGVNMNGVKVNDFIDRTLANCKRKTSQLQNLRKCHLNFPTEFEKSSVRC